MSKFLLFLFAFILVFDISFAFAHEPVFSLGPEIIFKGGVGIETEFEFEQAGGDKEQTLYYKILYGLTENIGLALEVPQFLEKKEDADTSSGLGDIALRGKYQFYRKDSLGAQDKATLIYGLKFPSGDEDKIPSLGTGSIDHLFGLSLGHESTTLYGFATGRYLLKTDSGTTDRGDQFLLDISFGFRPWLGLYKSWDLVLLLENSYVYTQKDEINRTKQANTGGQKILIGPTFLWSIRNIMFKGGVQFPVWQDLNGTQKETDFRSVAAIEYHF
jgi:hypothetical protein